MSIAEANAFIGQAINVRGLDPGGTVATHIVVTEIIRKDEEDVGLVRHSLLGGGGFARFGHKCGRGKQHVDKGARYPILHRIVPPSRLTMSATRTAKE